MPKPALREATDAVVRVTKTTTFGNAAKERALKFILTN
jgi:hypothetical protein